MCVYPYYTSSRTSLQYGTDTADCYGVVAAESEEEVAGEKRREAGVMEEFVGTADDSGAFDEWCVGCSGAGWDGDVAAVVYTPAVSCQSTDESATTL